MRGVCEVCSATAVNTLFEKRCKQQIGALSREELTCNSSISYASIVSSSRMICSTRMRAVCRDQKAHTNSERLIVCVAPQRSQRRCTCAGTANKAYMDVRTTSASIANTPNSYVPESASRLIAELLQNAHSIEYKAVQAAVAASACTAAHCHKESIHSNEWRTPLSSLPSDSKRAISFLFTLTLAAFLLHSSCKNRSERDKQ
jgi:hypothetical protein